HSLPIRRVLLESETSHSFLSAWFHLIGTDNQARQHGAVRKSVCLITVGAAVHRPHPAHANNADADQRLGGTHVSSAIVARSSAIPFDKRRAMQLPARPVHGTGRGSAPRRPR